MIQINPENERLKRAYFIFLREAGGRNDASIDGVAKALSRFEQSTKFQDFGKFRREQAIAFKRHLNAQISQRTGGQLSRSTVHSTLSALRSFFIWLAGQPRYKSKIRYSDAEYFNLSEKEVRVAKASREKPAPSLKQLHHVLSSMPARTDVEKRNRAIVAFTLLTGVRDGALISLKLKHVNLAGAYLDQDAREVTTKNSKTFSTWFFPVDGEALAIVTDWINHLRSNLLWSDSDPLFPATQMTPGPTVGFYANGLQRRHWTTTDSVRRIFRQAYNQAGLPYFNPHSIRSTLALLGEKVCKTPEEFKAWSQNMGHEQVMTTFNSYGSVSAHRQAEIIKAIGARADDQEEESIKQLLARMERAMRLREV